MKKLIVALLLIATPAVAYDFSSITFGITSSAVPSNPNLRIGLMKGTLGRDGNIPVQGMTLPTIFNYKVTKTKTFTFPAGTTAIVIQADQDTKLYTGSDLSNYLLVYQGSDMTYVVK